MSAQWNAEVIVKRYRASVFLAVCVILLASMILRPDNALAQVKAINPWPAVPPILSNGATATVTGKVVPAAGQGRVMLVAVACEYSATPATQTMTVTYGGQSATQIVTNISQKSTIWLGYLNETKIAAASSNTLSVTNSNTTGLLGMYATAALYAGVDQTTPTTGSGSAATAGATALTLTAFNVSGKAGNAGMSIFVTNWNGATSTPSAGYTEEADYAGANLNVSSTFKLITAAGTEAPSSTASVSTSGAMAAVGLNPDLKAPTITTCGGCHGYGPIDGSGRNVPDGQFTGSHNTHSGAADQQYAYVCTRCHNNNTANNHADGFKIISGSSVSGSAYSRGKRLAITSSPTFGTCNQVSCHSTGRTTVQYSTTPTWGQASTCLSCHAGRNGATGAIARSTSGFSLSTSHFQHLKYGASNVNCQTCHGKTATDAAALKNYSAVKYHVNGTADVIFTGAVYASYTAYNRTTKKCLNTSCHGGITRNAWSNNGALNSDNTCVHCHGVAGTSSSSTDNKRFAPGWGNTGISTDGRTAASDNRVGAHFVHLSSVYTTNVKCNECHAVPASPFNGTHMAAPRYASQTLTFAQASTAVRNSTTPVKTDGTPSSAATCSTTYCHGSNMPKGDTSGTARSLQWNQDTLMTRTPGADCSKCHGNPPSTGTTSGTHSGKTPTTSCYTCHGTVVNSTGAIIAKGLHINGSVQATGGHVVPYPGAIHDAAAGASSPWTACNSCHNTTSTGGTLVSGTAPYCGTCHTRIANFNGATPGCYDCHGASSTNGTPNGSVSAFPNWSGSHPAHVTGQGYTCSTCHANGGTGNTAHGFSNATIKTRADVNVSGSFTYDPATQTCSNNSCHGNAVWSVTQFDCITCHSTEMTIAAPGAGGLVGQKRRAVATEFTLTWSHKRSASRVVTKEDCIVCHVEGDKTTGKPTTAHKNGIVELRDPDTGLTIKQVTFSTSAGSGAGPGTFSSTAADATFTRFSRDLSVGPENDPNWAIIAGIEINMCLKCHDSNGASNASAQVPGGTALKPFNTTIVGHSAPFDANGVGNVVNVDKSFNTTNASYHPVKGRGNNSYIKNAMMKAPYTLATNKVGTNTTSYGILITCWDCHAPTNATGVQTATVTAHGGAVTLRRNIRTAASATAPSLCTVCHAESYRSTSANHGTASAFNVGDGNMNATSMANCHYCHSSYNTVYGGGAQSVRPLRGDDVHGFNDRTPGSVGSKWPSGSRPYAFWRTGLLSNWAPKYAKETLSVTATCGNAGKSPCSNSSMNGAANIIGVGGSY